MKRILYAILFMTMLFNIYSVYALDGWSYYRDITIDNTGNSNTLTDYQVLVTIDTASLISAGKMNNDCSDIRFTENDGTTELSYWIEDGTCNSANTKIWVKVPSITASSSYTIQMWYGNAGATAVSSIDNTFIFGDDFNDNSLDTNKWSSTSISSYSETNQELVCSATSASEWIHNAYSLSQNDNIIIEYNALMDSEGNQHFFAITPTSSWDDYVQIYDGGGLTLYYRYLDSGSVLRYTSESHTSTYSTYKIIRTGNSVYFYRDGVQKYSATDVYTFDNNFIGFVSNGANNDMYIRYVFVRKYTSPEPSTSVGEEQVAEQNVPVIKIVEPSQDTYYGITNQTFKFYIYDLDNTTFTVKAYLNDNLVYDNTEYQNDTVVEIYHFVNGQEYNFTVYATDDIYSSSSWKIFYVWHGANITANTNNFDLTVEINGANTTYTDINYKEIEWKDVGNNTYAEFWVTKEGYDTDYKKVLFNDTMGLLDLSFNIYSAHQFYLYDTKNEKYIQNWTLTIKNNDNIYYYSTNSYLIKVSTRYLPDRYYTLNATAFGYNYVEKEMPLNNSYIYNHTFETEPTVISVVVYDEKTSNLLKQTKLYILTENDQLYYLGNERAHDGGNAYPTRVEDFVDYDLNTYGYLSTDGTATAYNTFNISSSNKATTMCIKLKLASYSTGQVSYLYVYFYNKTSGSWVEVWKLYVSDIPTTAQEFCFNYKSNKDYGETIYMKLQYPDTDGANLYIYEIYPAYAPETQYILEPSLFNSKNLNIQVLANNYALRNYYVTIPDYSSLSLNAYLPSYADDVVQVVFNLLPQNQDYILRVKKYINDKNVVVHSQKPDISGKVTTYLLRDNYYLLSILLDGEERFSGYYVPSYAKEETIYITDSVDYLEESKSESISNVLVSTYYNVSQKLIKIIYNDTTQTTTYVHVKIENETHTVFEAESDKSYVVFTAYDLPVNHTYKVFLTANTLKAGQINYQDYIRFYEGDGILLINVNKTWLTIGAVLIIIALALLANQTYIKPTMLMIAALLAIFKAFGWLSIGTLVLYLIVFLTLLILVIG